MREQIFECSWGGNASEVENNFYSSVPVRMRGRRRIGGFTLVELLVVIAIIAILASILLPALQNARLSAYVSACISQQKQMYLGMHFYTQDWNGRLPYPFTGTGAAPTLTYVIRAAEWDDEIVPNVVARLAPGNGYDSASWMWAISQNSERNPTTRQVTSFVPTSVTREVFVCPINPILRDQLTSTWDGGYQLGMGFKGRHGADISRTHYTMNGRALMRREIGSTNARGGMGAILEKSNMPSKTILVSEFHHPVYIQDSNNIVKEQSTTFFRLNNNNPERVRDHRGRGITLVTMDGHAAISRYPANPSGYTYVSTRENARRFSEGFGSFWAPLWGNDDSSVITY